jgi:hypothetical protein
MFDQIHCSGQIHCSFGWFIGEFGRFIGKIGRYSSVGDFTVHILNQMNFGRFLPNSADFFENLRDQRGRFFSLRQFFKLWQQVKKNVMCIGPTGHGRALLVQAHHQWWG